MPGHPSNCSAETHSPKNLEMWKYQSLMGAVKIQFCLVGLNIPVQDSSVHGNFFLSSNSGPVAKDMYQKVMIDVPQDLRQL